MRTRPLAGVLVKEYRLPSSRPFSLQKKQIKVHAVPKKDLKNAVQKALQKKAVVRHCMPGEFEKMLQL